MGPSKKLRSPPEFVDIRSDRFWFDEFKLFALSPFLRHDLWQERCKRWRTHVNLFASLRGESEGEWKATRISFLFEHLSILDTKFNLLLGINTLLLVAFNVLFSALLNKSLVDRTVVIIGIVFGVSWLMTTVVCLIGERRLVWGDLGLIGADRLKYSELKQRPEDLLKAEEAHVKTLIVAVAKRTNKLRAAVQLTYLNVSVLAVAFVAALLRTRSL